MDQSIYISEDAFTLASGVTGIDKLCDIAAVCQSRNPVKLLFLIPHDGVLPHIRPDGKIIKAPFAIFFIVGFRLGKLREKAETPGNDIAVSLTESVLALVSAKDGSNRFAHGGLFGNY